MLPVYDYTFLFSFVYNLMFLFKNANHHFILTQINLKGVYVSFTTFYIQYFLFFNSLMHILFQVKLLFIHD